MTIELTVPSLGESIKEATVLKWLKTVGESFEIDEPLVEIETDKITLEVPAPVSGTLNEIKIKEGSQAQIGELLATIDDSKKDRKNQKEDAKINVKNEDELNDNKNEEAVDDNKQIKADEKKYSPSVEKFIEEKKLNIEEIKLSRNDGRLTKADLINHIKNTSNNNKKNNLEEIVPMSNIRKTIAKKLKESQNTAAILTTFNEVDMTQIIKIREAKKEEFFKRNNVKLGFMSFFVKAAVLALKEYSAVNAEIKDQNIIYKNYYDIGIAVGTEKGLVVPVLKSADKMTFGEIEKNILDLSKRAKIGKLTMEDLSGGTFTISNGGVYGSMLSTPIINSPQSGILGMHNIVKRPAVVDDQVVVRSIMYLAFSYDHRIIDGKESVGFLVKIKELLENPSTLVLGI